MSEPPLDSAKIPERVSALESSMRSVEGKLDRIAVMVENSGKTPWSTVAAALGVLVATLSPTYMLAISSNSRADKLESLGLPYIESIATLKTQVVYLEKDTASTLQRLRDQDVALQREMRDLITGDVRRLEAMITSTDNRIQREMSDRDEVLLWQRRAEEAGWNQKAP